MAEFILIIGTNLGIIAKKLYRFHYNIVKVEGVIRHHALVIKPVDVLDVRGSGVSGHVVIVGEHQSVLGSADGVGDCTWSKTLLIDAKFLHAKRDHSLLIIGIIYREALAQSHSVAVFTQNAQANGVEGAGPNGARCLLVVEGAHKSVADLASRLVCEGDGEKRPRGRRTRDKARQYLGYLVIGKRNCRLKCLHNLGSNVRRNEIGAVSITVFNYVGNSVDKDGGLARAGSRQHEKRPFGAKNCAALLGI